MLRLPDTVERGHPGNDILPWMQGGITTEGQADNGQGNTGSAQGIKPPELKAFRIDFSKARDMRSFASLYQMTHSDRAVVMPATVADKIPANIRECLIEVPLADVMPKQAGPQRRESGLIMPPQ